MKTRAGGEAQDERGVRLLVVPVPGKPAMYPDKLTRRARGAAAMLSHTLLGAVNTAVLICSSLTMALAVHAAQLGTRRSLIVFMSLTILLGLVFLGIKSIEYYHKFVHHLVPGASFHFAGPQSRGVELLMSFYFAMTGLHALHMVIGIGIMSVLLAMAKRGRFSSSYYSPVEVSGLYWHFVDIIWIFLFPLLYLVGRHTHV